MFAAGNKKTVSDPMDDIKDILWEYEVEANRRISVLLIVILALSFVILILLRFSFVSYDYSLSLVKYHCLNIVILTVSVVFTIATEGKNKYCKYLIMLSLVSVGFVLSSHYTSAHWVNVLPLLVCIAYRDKKMTILTSLAIVILLFLSIFVSISMGIFDYNLVSLLGMKDGTVMVNMTVNQIIISTLQNNYLVSVIFIAILSVLAYVVTSRNLEIMKQKAVADNRKFAMDRELTVASEIQKGMLPSDSYDGPYCNIFSSMQAAKEVGGDYYDYFMPDERHVTVLIADVSGKGIPASLFMATAKTMMHSYAMRGQSPADVFDSVNRSLCESNPEKMFVTAWMGTLDLETGRLTYANAGHNPPFIIREGLSAEMIKCPPNFILGRKKSIRYKDYHLDMSVGDKLFLYTDGVTEAMDKEKKMYTTERLNDVLGKLSSEQPNDIITKVCDSISEFTGDAQQSDDMTMVLLNYKGTYMCSDDPGKTFILNKDTYPEILSYITERLNDSGCIEKTVTNFKICSSEILSNIDMYAYSERGDGEINVSVNIGESAVKVVFTDYGPEYNPLRHSNPDSEKRISEHKIGGFGILIVKKMMDDIFYERKDGKNILTIKKFY